MRHRMKRTENPRKVKTGEEFGPDPQFRTLYYIYFLVIFILLFLSWYVPVLLFVPLHAAFVVSVFVALPVFIMLLVALYWIPKYYRSVAYRLTGDEMVWRRGVWFKKTGLVPYNRITNIDVAQGPVSRRLGIASLKIQTAGYSAPSTSSSEIRIDGMRNFEELRETTMGFVRGRKPVAVETYDEADVSARMLDELVKIRKLLSKKK
jgi:membrane protein YdbS with pleckstrin-like domain